MRLTRNPVNSLTGRGTAAGESSRWRDTDDREAHIFARLCDGNAWRRYQALEQLEQYGDLPPRFVNEVGRLLGDPVMGLRVKALAVLGKQRPVAPSTRDQIRAALGDEQAAVREAAVAQVVSGCLNDWLELVTSVDTALADPEPIVRLAALRAVDLAELPVPLRAQWAGRLVDDPDDGVRVAVRNALRGLPAHRRGRYAKLISYALELHRTYGGVQWVSAALRRVRLVPRRRWPRASRRGLGGHSSRRSR